MTEADRQPAHARGEMQRLQETSAVVSVRYQSNTRRLVVELVTGIQLSVPVDRVQGLTDASASQLREIEVSPSGLGLHWPQLDADVYVPGLLNGALGSKKWMASLLAREDAKSTSNAKRTAARQNGRLSGRPRTAEDRADTRQERQANLSGSVSGRSGQASGASSAVVRRSAAKGKAPS